MDLGIGRSGEVEQPELQEESDSRDRVSSSREAGASREALLGHFGIWGWDKTTRVTKFS